ncbi:hypothetical protein [Inquilinus limosus]|uniref:hypothetical protein n=1 Tax=Inquilinus limosus TaxID=171674 RepID=UPI001269C6B1|nr:hypothetical protein [Inquilinus limosus]
MTDWADIHPPSRARTAPLFQQSPLSARQDNDTNDISNAGGIANLPRTFIVPVDLAARILRLAVNSTACERQAPGG